MNIGVGIAGVEQDLWLVRHWSRSSPLACGSHPCWPQSITTERPSARMYRFDLARRVSLPGPASHPPKIGREPSLTNVDYAHIEIDWEGWEGFRQAVFLYMKKMRTSSLWRYLLVFPPVPPKYLKSSASIGFWLGGFAPRASHLPPMIAPATKGIG